MNRMGKLGKSVLVFINPIPHKLWKDVITRGWAIMAHKEKFGCNTHKKATIDQILFSNTYLDFYLYMKTKNGHFCSKI